MSTCFEHLNLTPTDKVVSVLKRSRIYSSIWFIADCANITVAEAKRIINELGDKVEVIDGVNEFEKGYRWRGVKS
jgi:hypothetical protein